MENDQDEGNEQGFDEVFITEPPYDYNCPICLHVMNQPMKTRCGHRFCGCCIKKWLREGRPNCPICNEELDESKIFPDTYVRGKIFNLMVRCRHFENVGCPWTGVLGSLQEHLQVCDYLTICCEHCGIEVVYKSFNEHRERCSRYPVVCPNNCAVGEVKRKNLAFHMKHRCAKAIVRCHLIGCNFEGTRNEVAHHLETDHAGYRIMPNTMHDRMFRNLYQRHQ